MKTVIVNGSPRKDGSTSQLCDTFSQGVLAAAPESEIIKADLWTLAPFRGCQSCFACKQKGGKMYGRCAQRDGLTTLIDDVISADCLVVATPIYLMDASSAIKAFLERLCFSFGSYEVGYRTLAPKRLRVITIYTMNSTADMAPVNAMGTIDMFLGHIFTPPIRLCAYDTYQFNDYSRYKVEVFDERAKRKHKEENWPAMLKAAYNLGYEIVSFL